MSSLTIFKDHLIGHICDIVTNKVKESWHNSHDYDDIKPHASAFPFNSYELEQVSKIHKEILLMRG